MSAKANYRIGLFSIISFVFIVVLTAGSIDGLAQKSSPELPDAGIPIIDWSLNQQDAAIAYSENANNFLVVWQHQWAVDAYTVINGRLLGWDGAPSGSVIGISQAVKNASAPSVAYNTFNSQFLVVWEHEYSGTDHDIYARRIDGDGTPLGIDLVVSQHSAYESAPVVAYNSTLNQYMVAWVYHVDVGGGSYVDRIYAQRLDTNGALIGGHVVVGSSAGNAIAPHLVYNPITQQYLLAWCGQDAGGDYDIFAQRLLSDGTQVGSQINLSTWENHQLYPRLAYNPSRNEYVAVWQDYHWDIGISQIYGQRIQADGALAGGAFIPPNQSTQGNRLPDVAYQPLSHGFVVVWERVFSLSDMDIYRTLYTGTGGILQTTSVVSGYIPDEKRPAVASNAAGMVQFVWEDSRNLGVSGLDIYGLSQMMVLPVFSGHVYEGEAGDTSTPLEGVVVNLHCSNSADEHGVWIGVSVTDDQGAFAIPCSRSCEYYNLVEEDPEGYLSVFASPPSAYISASWLQFTSLQDHPGNAFWDAPEPPVDTTPPGNWTDFQPESWTTNPEPEASVQVEDIQSGLDNPTAEFAFSTDGGASWSNWQPAGCTGPGGSTTPERVYAIVPFWQDSGTAGLNQVMFKILDRVGNPGVSPIYTVNVDMTPPWNPPAMFSTSHTPGEWSNNNQVTVQWDPASDVTSGVYGYSFSWDQSPGTLPNTTRDTAGLSYTNLAPVDASAYYFHLRTLDVAGNAAPEAIHSGPYRIDTQPPTAVFLAPSGAVDSQFFNVSWSGSDSLSDIDSFDVQSSPDGSNWVNWQMDVIFTNANFMGERGEEYYFRVRARDHAGNLSDWSYSGAIHVGVDVTVRVRNEFGDNIPVAEIYLNNAFMGFSDEVGYFDLHDVVLGDQLAAADPVYERYSNKPAHWNYGATNWAWREYLTSIHIEDSGATTQFTVSNTSIIQDLVVRRDQALVMVHILVSVQFDAEPSYLADLQTGLQNAATYLYDVTDGQFVWGRVEVFDNAQNWEYADVRIYANNKEWPHTNWATEMWYGLGGITAGTDMQIHMPPTFKGSYSEKIGFRTFIHEFGHYGLWLGDEYLDRDGDETGAAYCTTGFISDPTPIDEETQGSMMYQPRWATELCSRVDPIHQHTSNTFQDSYNNGESTWETVLRHYSGNYIDLISPDIHGAIVPGPNTIPIPNWVQVDLTDNNTGACPTFSIGYLWAGSLKPAEGVSVWLIRPSDPIMYQGKTDANGDIQIRGAHEGEFLVSSKYDNWLEATGSYSSRTIVNCAAQSAPFPEHQAPLTSIRSLPNLLAVVKSSLPVLFPSPANPLAAGTLRFSIDGFSPSVEAPASIVMQPDPFSLLVSFIPVDGETLELRVKATASLPAAPLAKIWQNGSISAIDTPLTYNSGLQVYTGLVAINPTLGRQGWAEVQASDSEAHAVMAIAPFNIEQVAADVMNPYLRSADGFFELMLPAGALNTDAFLSIHTAQPGPTEQGSLKQVGAAYQVHVTSGETALNLPTPVNLYFPVDPAANVDLETLQLYYWESLANRWLPAGNSFIDLEHNLVSTKVERLGVFALFAERMDLMRLYLPLISR
ncbi:hypothetical protein ACFLZW_04435 [Chloroflexota bacterium]